MKDAPLVLGIETSCDETGVGIVHGTDLLFDATDVPAGIDAEAGEVVGLLARIELQLRVRQPLLCLLDAGGQRTLEGNGGDADHGGSYRPS